MEIRSKIIVTEEEIIAYYSNHHSGGVASERFHILQIGCSINKDKEGNLTHVGKKFSLKRIESIRALALKGRDFEDLARENSELPSASDGGDLGFFTKDEMAPAMRDAISKIKPGELSEIVEFSSGFQFFKLVEHQEGKVSPQEPLEQARKEIQNVLSQKKMQEKHQQWVKKLREQAYIKIL